MKMPCVLLLAALSVPLAQAQTSPSTAAAQTSVPTTKPIDVSGYLAPIDGQEVKPKLKRFTSSLTVTQVVPHGGSVKAGQPLITFDTTELDQDILESTSDLDVAKAAVAKAEADLTSGERADAAMLEEKTDALRDAEADVAWWRDIEGPDFLRRLDLSVKGAQDRVDDQSDELDQLRKMYKSEQLTNATADIVVKRAVRDLERSQEGLEMAKHAADKQRATAYPDKKQEIDRALDSAKRGVDDANAQIAQSKVTRAAAVLKSRTALRDAERKLSELEQDKQSLDLKAKTDGTVYYGSFANGTWTGSTADSIKVGEKIDTSKAILTLIQPGKLRAIAKIDEANLFRATPGASVTVKATAVPGSSWPGALGPREPLAASDGTFEQKVELPTVDPRLLPGMKVKIEIAPEASK